MGGKHRLRPRFRPSADGVPVAIPYWGMGAEAAPAWLELRTGNVFDRGRSARRGMIAVAPDIVFKAGSGHSRGA